MLTFERLEPANVLQFCLKNNWDFKHIIKIAQNSSRLIDRPVDKSTNRCSTYTYTMQNLPNFVSGGHAFTISAWTQHFVRLNNHWRPRRAVYQESSRSASEAEEETSHTAESNTLNIHQLNTGNHLQHGAETNHQLRRWTRKTAPICKFSLDAHFACAAVKIRERSCKIRAEIGWPQETSHFYVARDLDLLW